MFGLKNPWCPLFASGLTNNKIKLKGKKEMSKSNNYVFGESEIDKEQFAKNMEIICQRCNGTGTDPDYKEVNVILAAIDDLERQDKKILPTVKSLSVVSLIALAVMEWQRSTGFSMYLGISKKN